MPQSGCGYAPSDSATPRYELRSLWPLILLSVCISQSHLPFPFFFNLCCLPPIQDRWGPNFFRRWFWVHRCLQVSLQVSPCIEWGLVFVIFCFGSCFCRFCFWFCLFLFVFAWLSAWTRKSVSDFERSCMSDCLVSEMSSKEFLYFLIIISFLFISQQELCSSSLNYFESLVGSPAKIISTVTPYEPYSGHLNTIYHLINLQFLPTSLIFPMWPIVSILSIDENSHCPPIWILFPIIENDPGTTSMSSCVYIDTLPVCPRTNPPASPGFRVPRRSFCCQNSTAAVLSLAATNEWFYFIIF